MIYCKRLSRKLGEYQRNVLPHARASRIADDYNRQQGRPLQYQNGGWNNYVMTVSGPEPLEARHSAIDYPHYLERQLQLVTDAILPFSMIILLRWSPGRWGCSDSRMIHLRVIKNYQGKDDERIAFHYHSALSSF